MYGVLLCDAGVVALASQADQPRLHPTDLLLLATFLRANDSLRQVLCHADSALDRHAYCASPFWPIEPIHLYLHRS